MNPALLRELLPLLNRDYRFKEKTGNDGKKMLRQGECPACGKKELWAGAADPWVLRCGRINKCGGEWHVKELYPELFNSWSERHPATPENPNAAADAYLRDGRGFKLEMIKGWYRQESWWSHEHNAGSAVVRFTIAGEIAWERIIDKPHRFGDRKATFRGDYKGLAWQPPNLGTPKELWITEGIFDAIALLHHGISAMAAMSSVNYPGAVLAAFAEQCKANGIERPRLVWALDGDKAGREWAKKHHARALKDGWESTAAVIPQTAAGKLDWNDMHQRDRLKDHHIDEYRYQGKLLLAATAEEKAKLIFNRQGWRSFPFDFDSRIWWFKVDVDKQVKIAENLTEAEQALPNDEREALILEKSSAITQICNCLPAPLYYLKNEVTDEAWYYFRITFPHDGDEEKNTFTAGQLTSVGEFKKRLLHIGAGAIWTGNDAQLNRLLSDWTFGIKRVATIDYIGYSIDHGAYVYNAVAAKDGRVVTMNDEDYFEFGKLSIKSLSRTNKYDINPDLKAYSTGWFDKFYTCFGPKGVCALAAWLGSLFAEQIRAKFESYPFVEIVGEPGAGKTTLLETLWKLLGRNGYEGFDPMKGSNVGFLRSMAQVANLPVVLIESDREEDSDGSKGRPRQAFHWDSLKSLFNGGSLRTTGVKSSGNDTYDPQFRAALVISQNAAVQASTPIMERIVHLGFDKSRQSDDGREKALELNRMTAAEMSGFLVKAITQEKKVIELMEQQQRAYEKRLEQIGVKNQRIQKNHAQLMVLVNALPIACPITESQRTEAIQLLAELAKDRERDLAKDHPIVERFWEAYEYLNGTGTGELDGDEECLARLNHSRDPDLIAINLNHFVEVAAEKRQQIPDLHDLKRLLKTSRKYKFVDSNTVVSSAINGRWNAMKDITQPARPATVRCWRFKAAP